MVRFSDSVTQTSPNTRQLQFLEFILQIEATKREWHWTSVYYRDESF